MFRRILAAVDSSPRAAHVFAVAREVGLPFNAHVFLFRVVEPPPDLPPAAATHPDGVDAYLRDRAREELSQLQAGDPRVVVAPPEISHVEPWHSIVEAARRLDAELIVLGRHAYGGWDRLLGTTTTRVVNHSDRHVLVVNDAEEPKR